MSNSYFDTVIVIGFGKIAQDIVSVLIKYDVSLKLLQSDMQPFSTLESFAHKSKLSYKYLSNKDEIELLLLNWISGNTLIISANNNYIFKDSLISLNNVTIINFHNALLPNLRGRNAPSWAIYHGLKTTGITWHYVDTGIDTGNAIVYEKVQIENNDKAYHLAHKCMLAGLNSFLSISDELLEKGYVNSIDFHPLCYDYLYLSKDIPGDGWININENTIENYKILRSLDYSFFNIFPAPKIIIANTQYSIRSYKYNVSTNVDNVYLDNDALTLTDKFGKLELLLDKIIE